MTTKITVNNIDTATITEVGVLANLTVSNNINIGNSVFTADSILPFSLSIAPEVLTINTDAPFAGNDIKWLFSWQQSTLPYARATIVNQEQASVPLYKQGTYQVNNFANEIHGNMDQRHLLNLKWVDGAGLDNNVSWSVNAGNVSFSDANINGGNTTTVQRLNITVPSSITIPTLNLPSNIYYNVAATTSNVYTFTGMGVGDNRTIGPLYRGATYTFNLDSSLGNDNKFYITTDNGTGFVANSYVGEYTSGVTGSRGNGAVGYNTLTFTVPNDAPDVLYYQSANVANRHGAMVIKDLAVETNINGNYVLYFQHMKEGHKTPVEIRPIPSMVNQMCLVYDQTVGQFVPQDMSTYVENTPSFKNKIREVAGTATLIAPNGVAVVPTVLVVEDVSYLPLVNNKNGDIAFDAYTDTMYVWDTNAWKSTKPTSIAGSSITGTVANATYATTAGTVTTNAQPNITSVGTLTSLTVSGNILPSANVTYNLGSPTQSFKDLYLSGNTIYFGGATIKSDANTGAVTIVPQPTANIPNPTAVVITGNGISTVTSNAGSVSANTIANAVANSTTAPQYGTITLAQPGNITAPFTGVSRFYPIANLTVTNVFASLGTASSGNLGFMLKKNGSNVGTFTVTGNTFRMSDTGANITVSTTDYLTLDVTSGSGATDLRVDLKYKLL